MVARTGGDTQRSRESITAKYILGICLAPVSYLCLISLGLFLALQGPKVLSMAVAINGAIGLWYLWKVPGWLTRWAYSRVGNRFKTSRATAVLFFVYSLVCAYCLSIFVDPSGTWSFGPVYPSDDIFQTTLMLAVIPYTYNVVISRGERNRTPASRSAQQNQTTQHRQPNPNQESVISGNRTDQTAGTKQQVSKDGQKTTSDDTDSNKTATTTDRNTMTPTNADESSNAGEQGNPLDYTAGGVEITTDPDYIGDQNLVETIAEQILDDDRESLASGRPTRLLLVGPEGSGKKTIIKTVAERYGISLEVLPPNENSPELGFDNGTSIVTLDNINEAPDPNRSLHIDSDLLRLSGPVPDDSLLVGIYQGVSDEVPDSLVEQFDYAFAIQCPKLTHRKKLIQAYLKDLPHALDEQQVGFIASWTRGCTGGEIKKILCEGAENTLEESTGEIQLHHIERAVIDILEEDPTSPGVDP